MPLRVAGARCGWPAATPLSGPARRDPWAAGAPQAAALRLAWRVAERTGAGVRTGWPRAPALAASHRAGWQSARPLSAPAQRVPWGWLPAHARASRLPWAAAHALAAPADRLPWGSGRAATPLLRLAWQPASARARHARLAWGSATAYTAGVRLPWWREFSPITAGVRGPWDHEPEPSPVFIIPVRTVYRMLAEFEVVRLPDRLPVEVGALSFGLSADARHWQFSATVFGRASLARVRPVDGVPVVVEATVQGEVFQALVEDYTEDEAHGRFEAKITGRSLSAWLDAPNVLPRNYASTAALNAAQLAEAELPAGWSLVWSAGDGARGRAPAPDWLVPAGAYSYQGQSAAAAIARIAAVAGCIVVPAPAAKGLTVQPWYPVLPWALAGVDADVQIPAAAVLASSRRFAPGEQANAVIVHGGDVGGVLAAVKRAGSAGDRLAQTASDALVTHIDAARGWGGRLLAAQAAQPALRSVLLPLGGTDFPLLELGQVLEIEDAGGTVLGVCSSVQVQVERAGRGYAVHQRVGLGEETANVWSAFARLLPGDPLLIGTVATVHSDGTATCTLLAGGEVRVRATGVSAGQQVYIRGGRVEGPAPALTAYPIEV